MKEGEHTRAQLLSEIGKLRRRVSEFEKLEEDLRRAQKLLADREALHRLVSELVPDRILRVIPGPGGQISVEWLLGEVGSVTGYTKSEAATVPEWKELVHPDDWEKVNDFRRAVLGGQTQEFELRVMDKDGSIRWMSVLGRPEWDDGNRRVVAMLCCARDITRSKTIDEESRRKAAYFRSSVENMLDGFGIFTAVRDDSGEIVDFTIDYVNRAALANSPLTEKEVLGKGTLRLLRGSRGKEFFRNVRRVVETGTPLKETLVYNDKYMGKNRTRTFDISAAKLGDGVSGIWRDVTDLKRVEQESRLAQERLEYLLTATPAIIYTAEPSGDYGATFVSANVKQLMGYEAREFVEDPRFWLDHVHPDDVERVVMEVARVLETDRHIYEYRFRRKDGRYVWVSDDMKLVRDEDGKPLEIVGYWSDITERKRTEGELIRLERLRALGQMAAGISHNLNNILTTILGPAKLLQQQIEDAELLRETEFILTSARRAKELVRRLNEAVRGAPEADLGPVSVNKVVREAVEITRPIWKDEAEGRNVSIELTMELGDVPSVRGTHYGLNDMVMNLLLNAVDAMPEGGRIVLNTIAEGDEVHLTVRDTGQGMDEDTRRRVFEPFFSTKMEIGTGLGLSTVYGNVTRWGGSIDVDSAPGEGTTFTIKLPTWKGPGPIESAGEGAETARRGRILIVEDVEPICALLARLLSGAHEVEVFFSGREALERFSPGRYDVAIIDLGLAGITGDRVGRLMRQTDTALATVLISGWDVTEGDPRVAPFDFWLEKPFDDLKQVEAVVAKAVQLHDARRDGQSLHESGS